MLYNVLIIDCICRNTEVPGVYYLGYVGDIGQAGISNKSIEVYCVGDVGLFGGKVDCYMNYAGSRDQINIVDIKEELCFLTCYAYFLHGKVKCRNWPAQALRLIKRDIPCLIGCVPSH